VENWLKLFDLFPYHKIHASGHLNGTELKHLVQQINPKFLIPVHTEHPEMFKDIASAATKLIPPEPAKTFAL
jgi:ribonuclease J